MVIEFVKGDIFESNCQAIINTVNCEGKMGKGLAFQFKKKFPEMEQDYIKVCNQGDLYPGKLHIFQEKNVLIINFPTKNKWRQKSKLEYVTKGLKRLKEEVLQRKLSSVAIPPLGAGNGRLNWNDVKSEIERELSGFENVLFKVYEPSEEVKKIGKEPKVDFDVLLLSYIGMKLNTVNPENLKAVVNLLSILSQNNLNVPNLKSKTKSMKEFKDFYSLNNYSEMYELINSKIISSEIESKKRNWNKVDSITELADTYPEYLNDIINCLREIERNPSKRFKINNELKDLMISENLIDTNIFEEFEINYF